MLADGDGEADIRLAADRDQGVVVEAAVGPHRELSGGPGITHPTHRLPPEVGRAPNRVGPALPQPRHQHIAGSGDNGQQRVIAPLAGVAVTAGTLLRQSVGLADGGIKINGQRPVARTRPRPGPATPGSPGPAASRGPTGNCAEMSPGWTAL